MSISRLSLLVLCVLPLLSRAEPEQAYASPEDLVNQFHQTIREAAQIDSTEARYRELIRPVKSSFDWEIISQAVLGKYWESMNVTLRIEFMDVFARHTAATYADRFDSSRFQFRTVETQRLSAENRWLVTTELIPSDQAATEIKYVVEKSAATSSIINVVARGVSDLAIKRAEFSSIIEKEGYDQLIARLTERIP